MQLPTDDFILLSVINTKLRDEYPSFEMLCEEEGIDGDEVRARLWSLGYVYDEKQNSFR